LDGQTFGDLEIVYTTLLQTADDSQNPELVGSEVVEERRTVARSLSLKDQISSGRRLSFASPQWDFLIHHHAHDRKSTYLDTGQQMRSNQVQCCAMLILISSRLCLSISLGKCHQSFHLTVSMWRLCPWATSFIALEEESRTTLQTSPHIIITPLTFLNPLNLLAKIWTFF
jgi:hypothetical protein